MPDTITNVRFQVKRGTKAALIARLVADDLGVPAPGEIIFETDTKQFKVGDGVKPYKDLDYMAQPILDAALAAAEAANNAKTEAVSAQASAQQQANRAQSEREQLETYVENKFWFGTIEEYNSLQTITPNSFYFITPTTHNN